MKPFQYFQPTEIHFGRGTLEDLGEIAARLGSRCLIVSESTRGVMGPVLHRVQRLLSEAEIQYDCFDGVVPNPTTLSVSQGAKIAREFGAQVVLGVGGGSSMDTAKAIAVE